MLKITIKMPDLLDSIKLQNQIDDDNLELQEIAKYIKYSEYLEIKYDRNHINPFTIKRQHYGDM